MNSLVLSRAFWLLLLLPAACSRSGTAEAPVRIDGSSTVFPLAEAVAEDFQREVGGGIRVTVGLAGTGGGLKRFCRGEIDIATASRPISRAELTQCAQAGIAFHEMPIAYDALTIVVHPDNRFVDQLSLAQLKLLWQPQAQQRVLRWRQLDPRWPDVPVQLYGAGADSGTYDYFTTVVTGQARSSRGDYTASEDDNVLVQGVQADRHALGYFGYAWYATYAAQLRAVPISAGAGLPAVLPSPDSVRDGSYQPLSRPLLLYVSVAACQRPAVRALLSWWLRHAQRLADEVRLIALAPEDYRRVEDLLADGRTGSAFNGLQRPGLNIDRMLAPESAP